MSERLLEVEALRVSFATDEGIVQAVDEVSFALDSGEVLAIVGESGCGKSVTALTLMGLTRSPNARFSGSARLRGEDLLNASERRMQEIRGGEIAMVFQDPMSALNPVQRVGPQIVEQIRAHEQIDSHAAMERAIEAMERADIPWARERAHAFPHELSGGMRQRAMIAMALSCSPSVLIADEPTTALDVTIQAQILEELKRLSAEAHASVILVTHDLGVVADIADRIVVMYSGRIVEEGRLDELFYDPQHPYTWGLLGSIARIDRERPPRLPTIAGQPPSLVDPPPGCHFRARCPLEFARCVEVPALESRLSDAPAHRDRCWLSPTEKRAKRVVGGQIGLAGGTTVIT
jgi:peptide/nickel transport system ATP-binding protein